jgi:hypothetical protein
MKDPHVLEMTASEPLSLEKEYAMQQLWKHDPKKCTFIISVCDSFLEPIPFMPLNFLDTIVGDVNLFFNDFENEKSCEIEVMTAVTSQRRKGIFY